MKKSKISLESYFWSAEEIEEPFALIDSFFDYADLDSHKQILAGAMLFVQKKEVYNSDYPGQLFVFYTAFRSFLKACLRIQRKDKKWKIKKAPESWSYLHQASLLKDEYLNPFLVFQRAFTEKTIAEFDFFLCEILHLSASPFVEEFVDIDLITPYIHMVKMLDAAQLMRECGIEKIANKPIDDPE